MSRWRKKPVVVEAVQFFGISDMVPAPTGVKCGGPWPMFPAFIETLEGNMQVSAGDWIITGVKGERYPCKPDIFAATYEPADASMDPEKVLAVVERAKAVHALSKLPIRSAAQLLAANMLLGAALSSLEQGEKKPLFLECGNCPWNIHGVHDEMAHYQENKDGKQDGGA